MPESPASAARRVLLSNLGAIGALVAPLPLMSPAHAVRPRAESPEVAIDPVLVDSGLATRWGNAMRRDLGWAARWRAAPSRHVLDQLESGAVEVGLFLSHPRASHLEKEGLIHDRRTLLRTQVWLVGPAHDPAGIRAEKDPARAIAQVLAAQAAGVAAWQTGAPGDPDGPLAQLAVQLLGAAGLATAVGKPPVRPAGSTALPLYQLVTQAAWLRQGPSRPGDQDAAAPRIWLQGHPSLVLNADVARSLRGKHPGGRLLVDWLDRPLARSAVRGVAGWQSSKG